MLTHVTIGADPSPTVALPVVYQLHVVLRGISLLIWRRLLVRSDSTIADLHYTLQLAMGCTDTHLHCFHIHGKDYGVGHSGGMTFADDPHAVRLAAFQFRVRECFRYEYNFHDNWQHDLRVERILLVEPGRTYPVCTGGKRAAPPEDCGGPQAFFEHLRASRERPTTGSRNSPRTSKPATWTRCRINWTRWRSCRTGSRSIGLIAAPRMRG